MANGGKNKDGKVLKNIHSYLRGNTQSDVPQDYEQFKSSFEADSNIRKNIHSYLVNNTESDVPQDFNEFESSLGVSGKKKAESEPTSPTSEKPSQPSGRQLSDGLSDITGQESGLPTDKDLFGQTQEQPQQLEGGAITAPEQPDEEQQIEQNTSRVFSQYEDLSKQMDELEDTPTHTGRMGMAQVEDEEKVEQVNKQKEQLSEQLSRKREAVTNRLQDLASNAVDEKSLDNLTQQTAESELTEGEAVGKAPDPTKAREKANELVKQYGAPEDGKVARLLENEIKARVEHKLNEPEIEKKFNEKFKNEFGKSLEQFKKDSEVDATLDVANRAIEQAKVETEIANVKQELDKEYKQQVESRVQEETGDIQQQVESVKQTFNQQRQGIQQQAQQIRERLQRGEISQEQAQQLTSKLEQSYQEQSQSVQEKLNQANEQLLDTFNQVKTNLKDKYNERLKDVQQLGQEKLKERLKDWEDDPNIGQPTKQQINKLYKQAAVDVYQKEEDERQAFTEALGNQWWGQELQFAQQFGSTGGNAIKNLGSMFDFDGMRTFGESMERYFNPPQDAEREWSDFLDPNTMAQISGQFAGSTAPSFAAGGLTALLTGGLGAGAGATMAASGFVSGAMETIQIGGAEFEQGLTETKSFQEAKRRMNESLKGQMAMFPLYALDGLQFIPSVAGKIGGRLLRGTGRGARAAKAGGVELGTEFAQELTQESFAESIREGGKWYEGFQNILDADKAKQTFINVSPALIMGGAPQAMMANQSPEKQAENFIKAQDQKESLRDFAPDQYKQKIANVADIHGANRAKELVEGYYANGNIDKATKQDLEATIDRNEELSQEADEIGLEEGQKKVFKALNIKRQEAERKMEETDSESVKKSYDRKVKEIQGQIDNLINEGQADFGTVRYADQNEMVFTLGELNRALDNESVQNMVRNGEIQVTAQPYQDNDTFNKIDQKLKEIQPQETENIELDENEQKVLEQVKQDSEVSEARVGTRSEIIQRKYEIDKPERATAIAQKAFGEQTTPTQEQEAQQPQEQQAQVREETQEAEVALPEQTENLIKKPERTQQENDQLAEDLSEQENLIVREGQVGEETAFFAEPQPESEFYKNAVEKLGTDENTSAYRMPDDFQVKDLSNTTFDDYKGSEQEQQAKDEGFDAVRVMEADGSTVLDVFNTEKLQKVSEGLPELRQETQAEPQQTQQQTEQQAEQAGTQEESKQAQTIDTGEEVVFDARRSKYSLVREQGGTLAVKDQQGNRADNATKRRIVGQYIDEIDLNGATAEQNAEGLTIEDVGPEVANDFGAFVAEFSQDPYEIASAIQKQPKYIPEDQVSAREIAIAENLGGNEVSRESFADFGDPNRIGQNLAKTYFATKGQGRNIDDIAQSATIYATEDFNVSEGEITPQEVIEYMEKYPNDPHGVYKQKSEVFQDLVEKFEQVSGLTANPSTIEKFANYERDDRRTQETAERGREADEGQGGTMEEAVQQEAYEQEQEEREEVGRQEQQDINEKDALAKELGFENIHNAVNSVNKNLDKEVTPNTITKGDIRKAAQISKSVQEQKEKERNDRITEAQYGKIESKQAKSLQGKYANVKDGDSPLGLFQELKNARDNGDITVDEYRHLLYKYHVPKYKAYSDKQKELYEEAVEELQEQGEVSEDQEYALQTSHPNSNFFPTENKRPQVSPIPGQKPKKVKDITLDISKHVGKRVLKGKAGRPRALGAYSPKNKTVQIRYSNDVLSLAHELGHSLDDMYNLMGEVMANNEIKQKIRELGQFGSNPPSQSQNPDQYRIGEGIAEWVRAYLINPAEAQRISPEFYRTFESKINDSLLKGIRQFGDDIRVLQGAEYKDKIAAQMADEKNKAFSNVREKVTNLFGKSAYSFNVSPFAKVYEAFTNPFHTNESVGDFVKMEKYGAVNIKESKDPVILNRNFNHRSQKIKAMLQDGVQNGMAEIVPDEQTGQPMTAKWLMNPADFSSKDAFREDMKWLNAVLVGERTAEYEEKFTRKQAEEDLKNDKLPPQEILERFPDLLVNYEEKINSLKDANANPQKLKRYDFSDVALTGIGAGLDTDLNTARGALRDFEQLQTSDPNRYERVTELKRRYRQFADQTLRYLVDKGRMSQEQYELIKETNQYYAALQRMKEFNPGEELQIIQEGKSGQLGQKKEPIKKVKGGVDPINDLHENLLQNFEKAVIEADRNEIMQAYYDLFDQMDHMYDGELNPSANIAVASETKTDNSIPVYFNGEEKYIRVNDQNFYNSLKGIGVKPWDLHDIPVLGQVVTAPARILRASVTYTEVFATRQFVRDTVDRIIKSKSEGKLKDYYISHEDYKKARAAGAIQSGHYFQSQGDYYGLMQGIVKDEQQKQGNIILKSWNKVKDFAAKRRQFIEWSEGFNRTAEYKSAFNKAKREGRSDYDAHLRASYEAADLIDFAVQGHVMRIINQMVPFANAQVQGIRKSVRLAKEDPAGLAKRWAIYAVLPTILERVLAEFGDYEDEWRDMPWYYKDLFWNFKFPGMDGFIRIPKPFEFGVLASGISRGYDYAMGDDTALEGYGESLIRTFNPAQQQMVSPTGPYPQMMMNRDLFRDKPIIPYYDEDVAMDLRNVKYSSPIAKWAHKNLNWDARQVDFWISSQFGYYGQWTQSLSRELTKGEDGGPGFTWEDTGFIIEPIGPNSQSAQWVRETAQKYRLESDDIYKEFKKLQEKYYDVKTYKKKDEVARKIRGKVESIRNKWTQDYIEQKLEEKKTGEEESGEGVQMPGTGSGLGTEGIGTEIQN